MKCNICGNEDENFFIEMKNDFVCLKCIKYRKREKIDDSYYVHSYIRGRYNLTETQKKISYEIIKGINKNNYLICAVTGAGKTEMIYPLIEKLVNEGKKLDSHLHVKT